MKTSSKVIITFGICLLLAFTWARLTFPLFLNILIPIIVLITLESVLFKGTIDYRSSWLLGVAGGISFIFAALAIDNNFTTLFSVVIFSLFIYCQACYLKRLNDKQYHFLINFLKWFWVSLIFILIIFIFWALLVFFVIFMDAVLKAL